MIWVKVAVRGSIAGSQIADSIPQRAMQGMHHEPIEAVCVGVGRLGKVGCGWRGVMDLSSV